MWVIVKNNQSNREKNFFHLSYFVKIQYFISLENIGHGELLEKAYET